MSHHQIQYLPAPVAETIGKMVEAFCSGKANLDSRQFYESLISHLPIEKMNRTTLIHRVEGLLYVTDLLWEDLLKVKKMNRDDVVHSAGIKPLSYYHYKLGSREPGDFVATRNDFLTDPPTALEKLEDDVTKLAQIVLTINSKATVQIN